MVRIEDSSRLIGKLRLGKNVYVAQGSILRSMEDSIRVGNSTMVLENSVLVGTPKNPLKIGSKIVFGHKCIALGAEIGDLCEIGNGVIIHPGAKIGSMCIFGEGTIIPPNTTIPDGSVVVGRPGRVIRRLNDGDKRMIERMRGNDISLEPYEENIIQDDTKEGESMGKLHRYGEKYPMVDGRAAIYDSAEITGDVIVGSNTTIASGVKIIGDSHGPVRIGSNVQILENTVLHLLPDNELVIEDHVIIGPGCIVHGCRIGQNSVIESGSIICDYSQLGENTLVKSGSLVKQRSVFANNEILEGFPARSIGNNKNALEKPDWAF